MAGGSINKVILIGNLGRDPEIRSTQDGRKIANFSVATSEVWKDKASGDKKERTEWNKVVVFSPPLVELIEKYIHKGSRLYIEGSLQTRKWTDKNGEERYTTEVVLQNYNSVIVMLDSKSGHSNHESSDIADHHYGDVNRTPTYSAAKKDGKADIAAELDDEIPF